MAAPAILAQGTTFSIDDDAGSPVTINGIQSVSGVGSGQASKIDVTTLASTAKEYRMGLQDWGDFTITFIYNPDDAGQAELQDAKDTQSVREFIMTLPSSDPSLTLNVWTAQVYVLQIQFDVGADDVVRGTATIGVTGEPVFS